MCWFFFVIAVPIATFISFQFISDNSCGHVRGQCLGWCRPNRCNQSHVFKKRSTQRFSCVLFMFFSTSHCTRSLDVSKQHLTQCLTSPAMSGARRPSRTSDEFAMDLMARVFMSQEIPSPKIFPTKVGCSAESVWYWHMLDCWGKMGGTRE